MYPLLLLLLLSGQQGILPPWEAKQVLDQAQRETRNLTEALGQLDTGHWKGDYTPLLVSTRLRVTAVADALKRLAEQPERLSLGVEAFVSMQHLETNVDSLARGAERFQPTAVRSLDDASTAFVKARDQFQGYLLDLARYTEESLAVSGKELESCRDQLWKRPPPTPRPPRPGPRVTRP